MTYIYKITSPSNKVYIGKTINIKRRYQEYVRCEYSTTKFGVKQQKKIYNSIIKYGFNNHIFEIIDIVSSSESDIKEKYYIELYNSYENGLNSTLGGSGGQPKGRKLTQEHRKKIGNANSGSKVYVLDINTNCITEFSSRRDCYTKLDIGYRIVAHMINDKLIKDGIIISEIPSINISEYQQYNKFRGIPVIQLSLNNEFIEEYVSASEAARQLNLAPCTIPKCCKDNGQTSGGYRWVYKSDYDPTKEIIIRERRKSNGMEKPIYKILKSTGEVVFRYKSITEADKFEPLSITTIKKCALYNTEVKKSLYHYKYEDYLIKNGISYGNQNIS